MKKFVGKVVAVDVDLTFVDTGRAWLDWCQKRTGLPINVFLPPQNPQMRFYYDLTEYFPKCLEKDLRLFWKCGDIYDNLEPLPGAVDTIRWLHDEGAIIWFLTGSLSHEQHVNKFDFLNKWCPFLELKWGGEGCRYENELIRVEHMHEKANFEWDVLIDDRVDAFPSCDDHTRGFTILMDTPYDQKCTKWERVDAFVCGWNDAMREHLEAVLED